MKKTTTLATVVAVTVTLMGSALCHAQAADPKKKQFEKLDADKNGSISLEEFKAKSKTPDTADAKFAKIDADKNGSVSLEEWSAGSAKKPKPAAPAAE